MRAHFQFQDVRKVHSSVASVFRSRHIHRGLRIADCTPGGTDIGRLSRGRPSSNTTSRNAKHGHRRRSRGDCSARSPVNERRRAVRETLTVSPSKRDDLVVRRFNLGQEGHFLNA